MRSHGRHTIPPLMALVTCGLLSAATIAACSTAFNTFQATDSPTFSLDVPAGTPVRVETFNGAIDVSTTAGGRVEAHVTRTGQGTSQAAAEADRDAIHVTLTLDGGTAVLRAVYTPSPDSIQGGRGAGVSLKVPDATALELVTSNGAVSVDGTGRPVDVQTSNGSVTLRGVTGSLAVRSSNGAVDVEAEQATADIRTSNATLKFAGSLQPGSHRFETSSGRLELGLAADAAFTLDATTSNGKISSDFAIAGSSSETAIRGTAGPAAEAAKTSIEAHTSNASVAIRHR